MQCKISQVADNVECFSASVQGIVSACDPFPIPVRRYILSMVLRTKRVRDTDSIRKL